MTALHTIVRTACHFLKPVLALFLLVALLQISAQEARAQTNNLVVIINPQGTQSEMSSAELKRLMRGEKQRWKDGSKVSIALMKTTHNVGEATAKQVYNMSGNELNKYWLALVFQGKAKAPTFFNSEAELVNYVQNTPGAVGVVQAGAVGGSKVLVVDGKQEL